MTDKPTAADGLGRVWAETGTSVDPDTITPGKVAEGWEQEIPPYEFMNFIQKFVTQFTNYINEQGIPVWDPDTESAGYPNNAYAKSPVNGALYTSNVLAPVGEPSISADWDAFAGGGGGGTTDDIVNTSGVSGATCTAALNTLNSLISGLDSGAIANISGVSGADVTAALNTLANSISNLTSTNIANLSGISGATVTAALNNITSNEVSNSSDHTGGDVSDALNRCGELILIQIANINTLPPTGFLGAVRIHGQKLTDVGSTEKFITLNVRATVTAAGTGDDILTSDELPTTWRPDETTSFLLTQATDSTNVFLMHGEIQTDGRMTFWEDTGATYNGNYFGTVSFLVT